MAGLADGIADFNYDQLFDPETNIKMGCAYLAFLHQRYDGDMRCMVRHITADRGSWIDGLRIRPTAATAKRLLRC